MRPMTIARATTLACLLCLTSSSAFGFSDGMVFYGASDLPDAGKFFLLNLDQDPALEFVSLSGGFLAIQDGTGAYDHVTQWNWGTGLPLVSYARDIDGDGLIEVIVHRGQRSDSANPPHASGQYFVIRTDAPVSALPADQGAVPGLQFEGTGPEPFNDGVEIELAVASRQPVSVYIVDVTGRLVQSVAEDVILEAGRQRVTWDGRDRNGHDAPSGVYFVQVATSEGKDSRRITLVR